MSGESVTGIAALAAVVRTGSDAEQDAARTALIRDFGHDTAEQIWADAVRQAAATVWPCDTCTCSGCEGCVQPFADDVCTCSPEYADR